jgi:hypothetical protein
MSMAMMMPLTQRYTKKRVRMRMRITLKRKIMPKMKIMIMPKMKIMIMPRRVSKWHKIKS